MSKFRRNYFSTTIIEGTALLALGLLVSASLSSLAGADPVTSDSLPDSTPLSAIEKAGWQIKLLKNITFSPHASIYSSQLVMQNGEKIKNGLASLPKTDDPGNRAPQDTIDMQKPTAVLDGTVIHGTTDPNQPYGNDSQRLRSLKKGTVLTACGGSMTGDGYLSLIGPNPNKKEVRAAEAGASQYIAPYTIPIAAGLFVFGDVKTVGDLRKVLGHDIVFQQGADTRMCSYLKERKLIEPHNSCLVMPSGMGLHNTCDPNKQAVQQAASVATAVKATPQTPPVGEPAPMPNRTLDSDNRLFSGNQKYGIDQTQTQTQSLLGISRTFNSGIGSQNSFGGDGR